MKFSNAGVPPVAFVQMLESQALDPDAVARLRNIMAREGTDEATLIERDVQAPLRWFREVYPDLDVDQATLLGFAFAGQAQLTSFGPLSVPLVSAGSVAEIVELLTYLPLISTAVTPQFHPGYQGLTVGFTGHTGFGHYHERYVRCPDGKWRIARSRLSYLQMDMHGKGG